MKYKTRGDYEAYLADQAIARRERAEQLRSKPRVFFQCDGYYADLYAYHPDGQDGPQLPEPWRWYSHMDDWHGAWYCQVTRDCIERLVSDAKKLFEIEE